MASAASKAPGAVRRYGRALAAAMLLPAVVVTALFVLVQVTMFSPLDPQVWRRVATIAVASLVVAAVWVTALGLPSFLLLRRLGAARWWTAAGAGFVLAAAPPAIVMWPPRVVGAVLAQGWQPYLALVGAFGLLGTAAALAFWRRIRD